MKTAQRIAALTVAALAFAVGQPTQAYAYGGNLENIIDEMMKDEIRSRCDDRTSTMGGYYGCLVIEFKKYGLNFSQDDMHLP